MFLYFRFQKGNGKMVFISWVLNSLSAPPPNKEKHFFLPTLTKYLFNWQHRSSLKPLISSVKEKLSTWMPLSYLQHYFGGASGTVLISSSFSNCLHLNEEMTIHPKYVTVISYSYRVNNQASQTLRLEIILLIRLGIWLQYIWVTLRSPPHAYITSKHLENTCPQTKFTCNNFYK